MLASERSAALGIAPPAGLVDPPPGGWDAAASATLDSLIAPLLEPTALLGMVAFGAGSLVLGWILDARHVAMAALGALLWAAALSAVVSTVGDGGLAWAPLVIAASALAAVAVRFRPGGLAPRIARPRSAATSPPATA